MAEKSKKKYTYGDKFQQRTQRVFELLLDCAFQEIVLEPKESCTEKLTKDMSHYKFEVTKKGLIAVANRKRWKNGGGWEFGDEKNRLWANEIYPALSHYLGDEFLGVLKGGGQQGSSEWSFTLRLWHSDKAENLKTFANKWQEAHQARSKAAIPQVKKADQGINWRTACKNLLDEQKQQLTSSPLRLKARSLDDVHVPLGLMEQKEKERPKFADRQEFSPEHGSEAYQQGYTEAKRVEHHAFLAEIGKRQPGEHVVILGEPGAGKTTLLMKVWEWLLVHEQPGEDIIVAWVPLAAVKKNELEDYLKKYWIKPFCKSGEIDRYWASFEELADAGRVWLLLDGADEMGSDALTKIERTLQENWALRTRAVITCRLNLWDASPTNKLLKPNFQVYRTLDFKYANPAGLDEVKAFIGNWFRSTPEPMAGQKLRVALDEAGKDQIKDLAQNPLRLTLLCNIWDDKKELPDTQARLYELFVDYIYKWKADEFPAAVQLRGELDAAMGDLAKQGINMLRSRFTEAELRKWVPVVEQREALISLGWLNFVKKEKVFVFLHLTFQEYFAACSIDDWDYFLPEKHIDRPIPCKDEDELTYRVFKSEWRHPIVLWFGRGDVADDDKEKFIEKLTNFQDGVGSFYSCQAYCMAAIGVGEFVSSKMAESIVQKIVEWAFGCFNVEKQEWEEFPYMISSVAKKTICFTHREYAIKKLHFLLSLTKFDGSRCSHIRQILDTLTIQNEQDGVYLHPKYLITDKYKTLDEYKPYEYKSFFTFIYGDNKPNQQQIEDAITSLEKPIYNSSLTARASFALLPIDHSGAISTLSKAEANDQAIKALITFLSRDGKTFTLDAVKALGKITKSKEPVIAGLLNLLENESSDEKYYVYNNVDWALNEIVTELEMHLVISSIKKYMTIEFSKSNYRKFNCCREIIFHYAQLLGYFEFYNEFHQVHPDN